MEQHADDSKKKRRIPEDLRKRALVSCDRCKKRRVRCLRTASGSGAQQGPCQSCLENGVKCESTLPRKQRIYGSIETLSIRYRVLDSLIKGLYPNEDTANIDVLYEIAEKNGIEVPSGNVEVAGEDVLIQAPTPASSQAGATPPAKQQPADSASYDLSQVNDRSSTETMEEKTLANPQGGPSHYIGPSSSFGFVLAIRDLVAQYNAGSRPGPPATKLPSDFVPPVTKAKLEPIVKKEASAWTTSGDLNGRPHDKKTSGNPPLLQAEVVASYAKRTLSSFLPSRKLTDRMVEAFFDRVHPNYMVLDPRSFYTRYRATWSDSRPIQDVEAGWTCVLFMVVVFGAQALEPEDKDRSVELQRRYLSLVLQRQYHLTSSSNLLNLQALLLAQLYQHNNRERNSSWILLGCATRMMVALGMHHEGSTGGFDSIEKEMRRRVWWTAYNVENNLCMILGRPSSIDESLINVELPDETMLDSAACVPLGYLDYSVRLTRLINHVKQEMYDEPEPPSNPTRTHIANRLLVSLEEWYNSLPPQLHPSYISMHSTHNRAVHLLHVQYHHTQTLITRPFILRKVSAQLAFHLNTSPPSLDSGEVTLSHLCCSYARQAVILLHQLSTMGMLDGVAWMDFYYLYHAVLILALDFLARPRDQRDTVEDIARKAAVRDALNAVRNARLCPTFTFLIQVSQQIAKIVGIFDVETTPAPMTYQLPIHASQSQTTVPTPADIQQQAIVEDLINEWFQYDPTNMPWHFFGALGSGELENSNMLVPVMGDMSMNDDGGAGIVYQTGGGEENAANTFVQWNSNSLGETSGFPPPQQQQPRSGNNSGGGGYSNNVMPMGP